MFEQQDKLNSEKCNYANECLFFTPSLQSRLEPFLWHVTLILVDVLHMADTLVMIVYSERRRASNVADDFVSYRYRQSGL